MITITIDKQYKIPETWDEIPLSLAQEIFKIPMPDKLKKYYDLKLDHKPLEEITSKDLIKVFPQYYGEVLTVLGIPKEVINKVSPIDRSAFYNSYVLEFVLGLHYKPNYVFKNPEYIEYGGEKLYFPKSKEILGNKIPMAYSSALEFSELADLQIYSQELATGIYGVAANIASIMCRPLGEAYDEDSCLKRAETMKDMKMSDCWEVFFCLIKLLNLQINHDQMYLKEVLMQRLKLPLKQQALVAGRTQLSKWGKLLKVSKT
jgi:hypothetical protein